jgi:hypothetical protein
MSDLPNPAVPPGTRALLHAYAVALFLYPPRFRSQHAAQMRIALRDALADPDLARPRLLTTLLHDLSYSVFQENLTMLKESLSRPILLFNALMLAALSTVLALAFYSIPQQVLRQDANDPQLELAGNAALSLAAGNPVHRVIATPAEERVNVAESLSPFLIAYDEQGHVLASSAQLGGQLPAPPPGVFAYARTHGEERVTWQPRNGVRLATVIRHVAGPQGGFVLAGRNMREVEAREAQMGQMARALWLAMLGIVAAGTFLFAWIRSQPSVAHP